jgi:hypothetical protein
MAQQGKQQGIGISAAQVIAGAFASVSAAVVASFFGIAGTLIGAAATSVVATVGGALYKSSIERAHARVVRIRQHPSASGVTQEVVKEVTPATPPWRIRWLPVLGGLAIVLALTFGAVTAVEVLAQKPLAAVVQQEPPQAGQTTLGAVVQEVTDTAPAEPTATIEPTTPLAGTAAPTAGTTATVADDLTPTPARKTAVPTTTGTTNTPTRVAPSSSPRQGTPTKP